jgi:hypothetical protein
MDSGSFHLLLVWPVYAETSCFGHGKLPAQSDPTVVSAFFIQRPGEKYATVQVIPRHRWRIPLFHPFFRLFVRYSFSLRNKVIQLIAKMTFLLDFSLKLSALIFDFDIYDFDFFGPVVFFFLLDAVM